MLIKNLICLLISGFYFFIFFRFFINTQFPGVVGCIDCTHIAIVPPKNQNAEVPEYIYVNRKGYHSLNVQLVNVLDLLCNFFSQ